MDITRQRRVAGPNTFYRNSRSTHVYDDLSCESMKEGFMSTAELESMSFELPARRFTNQFLLNYNFYNFKWSVSNASI